MSSPSIINCNLNCICINSDCTYKHFINYKERKIVKKFYDSLPNKTIEETNNETRKKNCTFGQLCENKNCGFKHRLSFTSREKLIVLYKFNKICPSSKEEVKTIVEPKINTNNKSNKNLFMTLDDDVQDDIVSSPITTPQIFSGRTWASVVKTDKPSSIFNDEEDSNDEEDIQEDDGFYMKF
jgi:hypothetical protein